MESHVLTDAGAGTETEWLEGRAVVAGVVLVGECVGG